MFPFEMEQLKGLPRSYTRLGIPCISRKEVIMLAWDMNVALKFLRHMGNDMPVTMESSSTINSAKENNNCIYRTKNGYQVLISLVGHSPRYLGSFATHVAATEAYEQEVSRLRHQIPTVIDLSRNDDEWDLPGYSHASHHSKSSACGSHEEHHGDVTQRNTKRPCTTVTAAKDTLAQDMGQLTQPMEIQYYLWSRKRPLRAVGFTSEPSTSCASVNKLNYGAVTPPRNM